MTRSMIKGASALLLVLGLPFLGYLAIVLLGTLAAGESLDVALWVFVPAALANLSVLAALFNLIGPTPSIGKLIISMSALAPPLLLAGAFIYLYPK